jgi:DNA-binding transcriptional regulator YiaG
MPMSSNQLRIALERLKLNQVQLGRALGVDPRSVRYWLAGDRTIPEPVAQLIAIWVAHPNLRPKRQAARRAGRR